MKRRAFTLTELLISMLVMAILAGAAILNIDAMGRQSAQREAEKVAAFINTNLRRADMTQDNLWITIASSYIDIKQGFFTSKALHDSAASVPNSPVKASNGCTFQSDNKRLLYPSNKEQSLGTIKFQPIPAGTAVNVSTSSGGKYYITVNGADSKTLYVQIGE